MEHSVNKRTARKLVKLVHQDGYPVVHIVRRGPRSYGILLPEAGGTFANEKTYRAWRARQEGRVDEQ